MTELIVKVQEKKKKLVEDLLKELGCKVLKTTEKKSVNKNNKKGLKEKISPFSIFGIWKDIDLDPETFRKKLWDRNHKF